MRLGKRCYRALVTRDEQVTVRWFRSALGPRALTRRVLDEMGWDVRAWYLRRLWVGHRWFPDAENAFDNLWFCDADFASEAGRLLFVRVEAVRCPESEPEPDSPEECVRYVARELSELDEDHLAVIEEGWPVVRKFMLAVVDGWHSTDLLKLCLAIDHVLPAVDDSGFEAPQTLAQTIAAVRALALGLVQDLR